MLTERDFPDGEKMTSWDFTRNSSKDNLEIPYPSFEEEKVPENQTEIDDKSDFGSDFTPQEQENLTDLARLVISGELLSKFSRAELARTKIPN